MIYKTKQLQETNAKNQLKELILSIHNVNMADLNELLQLGQYISFKKNTKIIEEGEISEYYYFIYKGLVKVYYYKNDRLVIDRFEKEGSLFGGNFSHTLQKPGNHYFDAVENVSLLKFKFSDLENLATKSHDIERLYRKSIELFHANYVTRLSLFKSLNATERYEEFVKQYGDVVNRVSLKDIANFLEMTPETLSRIRSKNI